MLGCGFSLARTTPLEHLIPSDGRPWPTAAKAYSICASFPEGENVVKLQSARRNSERNEPERVAIRHVVVLSLAASLVINHAGRFWALRSDAARERRAAGAHLQRWAEKRHTKSFKNDLRGMKLIPSNKQVMVLLILSSQTPRNAIYNAL